MTNSYHFPIELRVNQELKISERSRIDFRLFLLPSAQTPSTIISLFLNLLFSLIYLINSTYPLLSFLSFPLHSIFSPFFCPILYILLDSHPIQKSLYSPFPLSSIFCLQDLLNSKLQSCRRDENANSFKVQYEEDFQACISCCDITALHQFFSLPLLPPHLLYLKTLLLSRLTHPFFSISSCLRLLRSAKPSFFSALLLRAVMDLHFPTQSIDQVEYFVRENGDEVQLEKLLHEWKLLLSSNASDLSYSDSSPLEYESIDEAIQRVRELELSLPPCAKSYLNIAAEYLELGKTGRCFSYFTRFAATPLEEREEINQDPICHQLIDSVLKLHWFYIR